MVQKYSVESFKLHGKEMFADFFGIWRLVAAFTYIL
jgi:hypothetical protein